LFSHGTCGDHIGRIQCGCRTLATGHFELSRVAGKACRRYCRGPGAGAAIGLETSPCAARRGVGGSASRRAAEALSNECGGHQACARMDAPVRKVLATSTAAGERTRRKETSMTTVEESLSLNISQEIFVRASLETTF